MLDTKDPALGLCWTKPLKATPEATTGLSQKVFPCLAHQRSASHQRTLASTLLVLFLGDYLSCGCLCVCLYMCMLRVNATQVDIKEKSQKVLRSGLTNHHAPATDGNEAISFLSLHLHHVFFAFSSPTCLLEFSPSFSSGCTLCLLWVGGHPSLKQYTNPEWRADAVANQSNGWSSLSLISSSHGWNGLLGNILRILPMFVNRSERRMSAGYIYSEVLFQSDIKTTGTTPLSDLSQRSQTCHYIHFTSLISKVIRLEVVRYPSAALLCWGEFEMIHEINKADFWTFFLKLSSPWSCNLFYSKK